MLQIVQEWKAVATLSCATDKLDYVWNPLVYNVPVDNWRSAVKNGLLASTHVYRDEDTKKRVVKHLISTAFISTSIPFQSIDVIPLDFEEGINYYIKDLFILEIMPRFTKEELQVRTVADLKKIMKKFNIRGGKKFTTLSKLFY